MHVDFYFDYISPYAYLGWHRARRRLGARGISIRPRPVLFAGLLNHFGHLGPAEIPPKRAWIYRDVFRQAAADGIPILGPPAHPFNPLLALRVSSARVAGEHQQRVVETLFDQVWAHGRDVTDPEVVAAALDAAGCPGSDFVPRAADPEVKDELKRATMEALEVGVFGVPTLVVDGELFWGADRFEDIESFIDGKDPLDRAAVNKALARPSTAQRRK